MPDLSQVRAISFDLDYTLWDLEGVIERAEQRLYDFLSESYPRITERYSPETLYRRRLDLAARQPQLRHNVTAWRKAALAELAEECGYEQSLVEQGFKVFIDARHEVTPYPETKPVLSALHGRYRLGVITNGNADVGRLGLGGYFDFALSAVDIGSAKPDHLIFEAACRRAGVAPDELLHIGDEPATDVFGAAQFGVHAVWLNRDGRAWPGELETVPHIEVASLQALGELLSPEAFRDG
ncbi:haloacid dehalogenase [Alkalilimnicola ehrlichii]|uniref:Haloacid dehalogenase n=1 Tax=Alkalilimnicola ehrlichii TaxID=351052 RepID=A0A3E0X346_9GAMM|nr:haloacid dehalogenase [Alkalilimnicola ehrlichii]RFA39023.1 haloacid dehalogenase [Alkalilimnicola ehrlichii]